MSCTPSALNLVISSLGEMRIIYHSLLYQPTSPALPRNRPAMFHGHCPTPSYIKNSALQPGRFSRRKSPRTCRSSIHPLDPEALGPLPSILDRRRGGPARRVLSRSEVSPPRRRCQQTHTCIRSRQDSPFCIGVQFFCLPSRARAYTQSSSITRHYPSVSPSSAHTHTMCDAAWGIHGPGAIL